MLARKRLLVFGGGVTSAFYVKNVYEETLRDKQIAMESNELKLFLAKMLPLRMISRCWGFLSEIPVPMVFREPLYGAWIKAFNCDMSDVKERNLKNFTTFQDFFIRALREDSRPVDPFADIVSPVDGKILSFGKIPPENDDKDESQNQNENFYSITRVKGFKFSLKSFFGSNDVLGKREREKELYYCTIYLSPADYHRFHSPANWLATNAIHHKGDLFSVHPRMLDILPGIFVLNERICLTGNWHHGFMSITFVGATNVGSIHVHDFPIKTNSSSLSSSSRSSVGSKNLNIPYVKGKELGYFRLGSSVVIVFEGPKNFAFNCNPGDHVKMGQSLLTLLQK